MPVPVAPEARHPHAGTASPIGRIGAMRIGLGLVLAAALIFWLGRWTDIDLHLADRVYDPLAGRFPWRDAWLTVTFNHGILKRALSALAAGVILTALADAIRPLDWVRRHGARWRLRVTAWSAALVPLAISLLKQNSSAHCPWDLARYGGAQPYLRLLDALPAGVAPGHCLPAGHASTALWTVALAVWWLPAAPVKARRAASAALGFGFAVGWMQQMRGAHFLTHTLWSMWIACAIVFALTLLLQPSGRRARRALKSAAVPAPGESHPRDCPPRAWRRSPSDGA